MSRPLGLKQVVQWTASWERRATQGQKPVPPLPRPTLENDALLALLRHHGWRNSTLPSQTHQLSHILALTHSLTHTHTHSTSVRAFLLLASWLTCTWPCSTICVTRSAYESWLDHDRVRWLDCDTRTVCGRSHTLKRKTETHTHTHGTDDCILRNHDHHFQSTQVRGRGGDAGRGGFRPQERPRGSRCAFRAQHTGHISLCCRCCLCVCVRVCR
jgi:hypothetical protein